MRRCAVISATLLCLCPALGWAQDSGAEAFANRDFATAKQLWQQEAATGSAEAMLGLGLLADRGHGGARDLETAFDWYAKAADLGLAEAQFNLAIMYDAGLGRQRDSAQAVTWYTRAALRGHPRAQYNLGLLYETEEAETANPDLASYWFEQAAQTVPAAAEKSRDSGSDIGIVAAPTIAFAQGSGQNAELVWQSAPQAGPTYLVEILEVPVADEDYPAPVLSRRTTASGLLDDETPVPQNSVLRVSNISNDATDYAASAWVGNGAVQGPDGRVTLMVDPASPAMATAATLFATDLRAAGYWVRVATDIMPAFEDFYISYGYTADLPIVERLANYLPRTTDFIPVKQVLDGTQPGEIIVNLAAFR